MPRVTEAHLEARRRQILAAAVRCFAREGFHQTSMQDILAEAELSTGAVYRYFASKDELIEVIAEEVLRTAEEAWADDDLPSGERVNDADLGEDVIARLFSVLEGFSVGTEDERVRLAVQLWAEALRSPHVMALLRRSIERFRTGIAERIRAGQTRGEIDADLDAVAVARAVGALFEGFVLQRAISGGVDIESYREAAKAMVSGLTARSGARRPERQPTGVNGADWSGA